MKPEMQEECLSTALSLISEDCSRFMDKQTAEHVDVEGSNSHEKDMYEGEKNMKAKDRKTVKAEVKIEL